MHNITTVYQEGDLNILCSREPFENIIHILDNIVYGTNGPLYKHTDVRQKLYDYPDPYFFSIYYKEELIGTILYSKRDVKWKKQTFKGYYSRYFAIKQKYRQQSYGSLLKNQSLQYLMNTNESVVFYSYLEKQNERSYVIAEKTGNVPLRTFNTHIFSRVYPKADKRVEQIKEEDKYQVLENIKGQYCNHNLICLDNIFYRDQYFVLKENEEIIAGLQANPVKWQIIGIPGFMGFVIEKILPNIPVLKRLFDPKKYHFSAVEGIFFKAGRENALLALMEHVLNYYDMTSAIFWADEDCPVATKIINTGKLGLLDKFNDDVPADVMTKFINFGEDKITQNKDQPVYISAFDLS